MRYLHTILSSKSAIWLVGKQFISLHTFCVRFFWSDDWSIDTNPLTKIQKLRNRLISVLLTVLFWKFEFSVLKFRRRTNSELRNSLTFPEMFFSCWPQVSFFPENRRNFLFSTLFPRNKFMVLTAQRQLPSKQLRLDPYCKELCEHNDR